MKINNLILVLMILLLNFLAHNSYAIELSQYGCDSFKMVADENDGRYLNYHCLIKGQHPKVISAQYFIKEQISAPEGYYWEVSNFGRCKTKYLIRHRHNETDYKFVCLNEDIYKTTVSTPKEKNVIMPTLESVESIQDEIADIKSKLGKANATLTEVDLQIARGQHLKYEQLQMEITALREEIERLKKDKN